jgi:hypothetical protein
LLYGLVTDRGDAPVEVRATRLTGEDEALLRADGHGVLMSGTHLLFPRGGYLYSQQIDDEALRLIGEARRIGPAPDVRPGAGYTALSAAAGVLAYAEPILNQTTLTWWSRAGERLGTVADSSELDAPSISPDGRLVGAVLLHKEFGRDVWTYDVERGVSSRITQSPARESSLVWAPDGQAIAYSATQPGSQRLDDLHLAEIARGTTRVLTAGPAIPTDWTRDGRWLLFHQSNGGWQFDLRALDMRAGGEPRPLTDSPYIEAQARVSPDGRWIAFISDETGRLEVQVAAFPLEGRKWTISDGGGSSPMWRGDGRELVYLAPDTTLMSVSIGKGPDLDPGKPVPLFRTNAPPLTIPYRSRYDLTPDGQRFLIVSLRPDTPPPAITVRMPALDPTPDS